MDADALYRRYQELQAYVGWTEEDARHVVSLAPLLKPYLPALVEDFYAEINRHAEARKVITGGSEQIERLKCTLLRWLNELLSGIYDRDYVVRRWRVGWRHVEIGLDQAYTHAALSRLRRGLLRIHEEIWKGDPHATMSARRSLSTLLDLDLAVIEEAYHAEYLARQQRSERLATIGQVAGAAPCMLVILRPDASIVYFSPFAEELTGYSAEEVLGRNYLQLFIAELSLQQAIREDIQSIQRGRLTRGFENPIRCKDGSHRWMVWNVQLLPDHEGQPAILAVGQDITSLKEAQEQTLQAERLAAIGQMMAGLAHESGNALARSQACLEMLALEVEDRSEALDLITRIQNAQNHLQRLYEEVRGYAAPVKLQRDKWDLSMIWRQAWTNLAMQRQGREASLDDGSPNMDLECSIDSFRLEQVFRNIFENSLAACQDPVEVTILCKESEVNGQAALVVSIQDNGPGLSAEQCQKIFDPFFTTKTKGTGLGMAIAQRIIQAHGGRIAVGPNTGRGAEMLITLPRSEG